MEIAALFLSPGHNFFGHYGQPAGSHPALAVPAVECVAGRGLLGDRFFDHKPDYKGQITFFSAEVFDALCAAIEGREKSPALLRRNVLTRRVDLDALIGATFEVQDIRFQGTAECSPCRWMNEAIGPGAEDFLKGRGGLRARILTSGTLRVDHP
jgi:MOSC domain-containing protein YiiM